MINDTLFPYLHRYFAERKPLSEFNFVAAFAASLRRLVLQAVTSSSSIVTFVPFARAVNFNLFTCECLGRLLKHQAYCIIDWRSIFLLAVREEIDISG